MYDDLAMYDGSVVLERTSGEISARCDKEGANFLALNLAHDIVTGKRSVQDARKMYGEQAIAMMAGRRLRTRHACCSCRRRVAPPIPISRLNE